MWHIRRIFLLHSIYLVFKIKFRKSGVNLVQKEGFEPEKKVSLTINLHQQVETGSSITCIPAIYCNYLQVTIPLKKSNSSYLF